MVERSERDAERISLREFVVEQIKALKELHEHKFVAGERALNIAQVAAEKALTLAMTELQRRLDVLNHAHQEAQRVQNTYVPRESWDASNRENQVRFAELTARVEKISEGRAGDAGGRASWVTIGAFIMGTVGVLAGIASYLRH